MPIVDALAGAISNISTSATSTSRPNRKLVVEEVGGQELALRLEGLGEHLAERLAELGVLGPGNVR